MAGLVGACAGELTVGAILDASASLLGREGAALWEKYVDEVRALVRTGSST